MRNFTIIFFGLFLLSLAVVHGQTRVVKGTLTDPESGLPMPGVNVVIKGSVAGTVTDINGNYEIEAPIGSTLVFSFVGYSTKEILVGPEVENSPNSNAASTKVFRHSIPDDPEKTLSPYFFIKSDDPALDQMPLKSTSANVNIAGVIADVTVKQVYINTGDKALEAVYIFPGSTRAAVYGMTMNIGARRLVAKIKEKEQARADYETAKQQGKSATLLEQKRPNIFQMNVANILPGDTISVELKYTELLTSVNGTYEFIYPTVVGPRYSNTPDDTDHAGEKWIENPFLQEGNSPNYTFDLKTTLNSGIPIQRVVSTSHDVNVNFSGKNSATITLKDTEKLGGNRDFILQYRLRGGKVESGLLLYPRGDENFFLLMMEPPEAPALTDIPPREYIFIVDVSGSMSGFPIEVSKRLLRNLISSLRPTDRFNVMLFESSNRMLNSYSVPATSYNIESAIRVMDNTQGGGGTELYPALRNAFDYEKTDGYSRTFVVITDGYVTIEKDAFNLVKKNLDQANLFAIGIGSSVNRYLIEGLAHAGMGEPFIVTSENEAEAVGKKFIDIVRNPVLINITIDYGKFKVYDVEPMAVPDVFVERPIIVFGKYSSLEEGVIRLSGYSGSERYEKSINVSDAIKENNESLRYLWARNKIKYVSDYASFYEETTVYGQRHQTTDSQTKLITELGLKYNLLTQFTSFIAIDSLIRNHGGQEKVKQPLPLPQGVSNSAVSLAGLSLSPDVQALSEVIVTGYGAQQKQNLVYSVSSVSSSDAGLANSLTVSNALQGRVAGVQVTQNSGASTPNTSVRIRGNVSYSSSNEPLYVLDGVPLDNTSLPTGTAGTNFPDRISDINPEDIESIQVLRSAAASSIYGSRGANGVIIITSKKVKKTRREIEFSSSISMEEPNKLPKLQQTYSQGRPENGNLLWRGPETGEVFSWGPPLNELMHDGKAYDFDKKGKLTPITADGIAATPYNPYDLFRKGITTDNFLRIGFPGKHSKYGVTVGDTRQRGIIPGASYKRTTLRVSGEWKWNRLAFDAGALATHTTSDLIQRGNSPSSITYGLFTTPPSFDNGNGLTGKYAYNDWQSYQLPAGSQRSYSVEKIDNPYWSLNMNPTAYSVNRVVPNLRATYELSPDISLKSSLSADVYKAKQFSAFDINSAASPSGQFTDRNESYQSLNFDLIFDGRKRILNDDVEIMGKAGVVLFADRRNIIRQDGKNLSEAGDFTTENANEIIDYSKVFEKRNARVISGINFKYLEILSLDMTSALEKTTTLTKDNNLLPSGSVGLSFIFNNLPGLRDLNVLNAGKIFASVGRIQKEAPQFIDPNYALARNFNFDQPSLFVERTSVEVGDNVTAEMTNSLEAGTSISLFDNSISLDATWYWNTTSNLFIPSFNNSTVSLVNGGKLSNNGAEITLSVIPLPMYGDFRWNIKMHFSRYRSLVKDLYSEGPIALAGFSSISSSLVEGQPFGVLYGTRYLRDQKGQVIIANDGFPMVDQTLGVLGNPNPDWTMGFENSLSFKGISLRFLIDVRRGGQIWNGTRNTLNYYGASAETDSQRNIKGYVFAGNNVQGEVNTVPVDFLDPSKNVMENRWTRYGVAGVAEDAIEDGSWVRLRDISLTYRMPDRAASWVRLNKLEFSLHARNLFLITNYSGIDPETNLTGNSNGMGLDYFNLPNARSYGVTVRFGL